VVSGRDLRSNVWMSGFFVRSVSEAEKPDSRVDVVPEAARAPPFSAAAEV